ncbi:MAG: hypothetical protein WC709_10985, partial [Thermoleophilia bacterium]
TLTVVKVGGSLARGGRLRPLCAALARTAARHDLLVVPGGGVFADAVRELDARVHLEARTAHWMAVLAMDQFGLALAELIPRGRAVCSAEQARVAGAEGAVAVLLPYEWLRQEDPLPHDWSVTGDSIAAWVARECRAGTLVLLKDRRGVSAPLPGGSQPPRGALTAAVLGAWEGVDGHLGRLLDGLGADVWILDGERPERLDELLDGGEPDGISVRWPAP